MKYIHQCLLLVAMISLMLALLVFSLAIAIPVLLYRVLALEYYPIITPENRHLYFYLFK